jgi:ankyrin repeat protein
MNRTRRWLIYVVILLGLCGAVCGLAWRFLGGFQDALLDAVYSGNKKKVEQLLMAGESPNKRDSYGNSPLTLAGFANQCEIAEILIAYGGDLTVKDNLGMTPLHCAVYKGNIDVARVFVERGAPINAIDEYGYSPLSEAAAKGPPALVEFLLAHGAQVNHQDKYGWQPIHIALRTMRLEPKDRLAIVAALLQHGADPNAWARGGEPDSHIGYRPQGNPNKGNTPLAIAESNGFTEIVALLKRYATGEQKRGKSVVE